MPPAQKRQRQSAPSASNPPKRRPGPTPARKSNGHNGAHQPPHPTQQPRPQQSRPPQQLAAAPVRVRNGQKQNDLTYGGGPPSASGSVGMQDMGSASGVSEAGDEDYDEGDEEEEEEEDEAEEGEGEGEGGEAGDVCPPELAAVPYMVKFLQAICQQTNDISGHVKDLVQINETLVQEIQASNKERFSTRSAMETNNQTVGMLMEGVKVMLMSSTAQGLPSQAAIYRPPQGAADQAGANQFTPMQPGFPFSGT